MSLGNKYDLGTAVSPSDLAAGASTGKRLFMPGLYSVDVVVVKGAGTADEDPVISVQSHAVPTAGTPQNLAVVSEYFTKSETALDNDEVWVRNTQVASHQITATAEEEQVIVFTIRQQDVPSGRPYVSVNVSDAGDDPQVAAVLYVLHPQDKQASPVNAPAPLR
jgi:hypothetical protein